MLRGEADALGQFSRAELELLAHGESFPRGESYFRAGRVEEVRTSGRRILAVVRGSRPYRVELDPRPGALHYACDCPLGREGHFCKHLVAAGLAWLARSQRKPPAPQPYQDLIRSYLMAQEREALVVMLLALAAEDPALRFRLLGRAMSGRDAVLGELPGMVRHAFRIGGGQTCQERIAFRRQAELVVGLLEGLLAQGRAEQAQELAAQALEQGLRAREQAGARDGVLEDLIARVAELHLEACRQDSPRGEELARTLLRLQLQGGWGLLALEDYLPLLDEAGYRTYRRLVERRWAEVPALEPEEEPEPPDPTRRVLTGIMRTLARWEADLETQVAVERRDLSWPGAYGRIARLYAQAGRHREALAWAERGRRAFPDSLDPGVAEVLIDEYRRSHRQEEALDLAWEYFCACPHMDTYRLLQECAGPQWPQWREKALGFAGIWASYPRRERLCGSAWLGRASSLLVEILLAEGDSQAALAQARARGCSLDLWLRLARVREQEGRPADTLWIYQFLVEELLQGGGPRWRDQAVDLVQRVRCLLARDGREEEFTFWLERLRHRHGRRRSFWTRLGQGLNQEEGPHPARDPILDFLSPER
jgi:tetratricopeptide (TPR) repeat protein